MFDSNGAKVFLIFKASSLRMDGSFGKELMNLICIQLELSGHLDLPKK